ncbi:MAG TPA: hypothetical protein VEZ11_15770 [Thermoanaerobaculia bacterium]|nr:hypothetical protein [Thermoanaerobaculia bacterium]
MSETETAFLRIAGITIGVTWTDRRLVRRFADPVRRFVVKPGEAGFEADVTLSVERMPDDLGSPGRLLFDSGGVWRLFEESGGYRIECRSEVLGDRPYKIALFDGAFAHGRILVSDVVTEAMNPLDFPLDELLISNLLGRGRGVELHGCGLIDSDGRGHLFVGQSGAGKTTTARIWLDEPGVEIVSDDRVIVREIGGVLRMFGTPWHGEAELSSPQSAPLSAVYLLVQAAATELVPMAPADAAATLFGCTFPQFHDPDALAFTIGFLGTIAERVPVRALRFTPDRSIIAVVRQAMERAA